MGGKKIKKKNIRPSGLPEEKQASLRAYKPFLRMKGSVCRTAPGLWAALGAW